MLTGTVWADTVWRDVWRPVWRIAAPPVEARATSTIKAGPGIRAIKARDGIRAIKARV